MTEAVTYTLLNPTGNMTLLAETPVPEASQALIARKLMALEPETEQVGFVCFDSDSAALRMAGGEFCGNASMSTAVLFAARKALDRAAVSVTVSGTPEPVAVTVEKTGNCWHGEVTMPRPVSVKTERFPDGSEHPVVRLPGITHVILEKEMGQAEAEQLAPVWCRLLRADGLGLMFLDRERGALKPLVYVPETGTLFWESSCASGTTAVGAWLAKESGQAVSLSLKQPGGTLNIAAEPEGKLILSGTVEILRRCSAALTDREAQN